MSNTIPEGWAINQLGKLTDVRSSNVDKKTDDTEIPVRLCNYMDVYRNNSITSEVEFMEASAKQREIDRFTLEKGDVIITKDSETPDDIAVPSYVSESLTGVVCGYHLTLLRPHSNLANGQFLSHLFQLQSVQHYFYLLANGTTRFGLTADAINAAPLLIPPLPEQQKIASILSSADEVIEKTRAQIDKLKDLKTGMMQELLTKGIGHTEFKDSPVGRIPSNWEVGAIDSFGVDILDGDRGKEYPKEKDFYPFEHCLFLSAKNVTKKGFAFTTLSFITKEKDELLRKGKLTRGDIVITTRGTVGNIAFYNDEAPFDHIRINSGMAIIRNKSEALDSQFLHLLMNSPMVSEQVELLAFGSAQPQLTIGIIKGLNIPKPCIDEQKAIASAVSSVTKRLQLATKKLALLESAKKALMQDLLTGKVRVNVANVSTAQQEAVAD
ncbi:restriction endonuclease subunit S [Oceanisphaera pacifica]|uniref:Restriction endonuclease subunit S n=1 Tax=Oceanisphaera pacifica TaxID=2818389 RepID=A0ABS3NFQ5_9GAMM|nr:restriction endonuclease subunit S [Oceanisphaera pacifica]MBO1519397.1 restriction endonuclease subunit S [Oceanisphaera pacifica]